MVLKSAENTKSPYKVWLDRIIVAVLLTLAIQLISLYIKYGSIFIELHFTSGIEFFFTFLYFLALFWLYPKISSFVHASLFKRSQSVYVGIIEGMIVVLTTFVLITATKILPIWVLLLYLNTTYEGMNASFDVAALRRDTIVHAILGLFFYYFVERERIRKQIQAEHLHYAKLQREEFKSQLENLKNQVNPRFLFDSLNTLDSLIERNPEEAGKFVSRLSYVYRSFLDRKEELVSLAEEMELIEAYTYLLKVRFRNHINFDVNISPEYLSLQLPPGCIQVLIENAVLYYETSAEEILHIYITTVEEKLLVRNGLQEVPNEKPSRAGLKNIIERYRYLTDEAIEIEETAKELIVKLPLLRLEYEEISSE